MSIYVGNNKISFGDYKVYVGSTSVYSPTETELTELCFRALQANSTVELTIVGSPSISDTAYSTDRQTWTTFTPSTTAGTNTITLTNVGDKVYFRNNINANLTASNHLQFVMSGKIAAKGNCNSLYTTTNFNELTTLVHNHCFSNLFYNCTALYSSPNLPATILDSVGCYWKMFYGCTNLLKAPALPATTLYDSCYSWMFYNCDSLVYTPVLAATVMEDYCYSRMFQNCGSLKYITTLPSTELATSCYLYMFSGCSSLVRATPLPATTLKSMCYYSMFSYCTSLTTIPAMPGAVLTDDCYGDSTGMLGDDGIFAGCTSLYISDTPTTEAQYVLRFPQSGTFTNTSNYSQPSMFVDCLGERASEDDGIEGESGKYYTFYTQNLPLSASPSTYNYLKFTANTAGSTITMDHYLYSSEAELYYSDDGGTTWEQFYDGASAEVITLTNVGDSILIKGNNPGGFNTFDGKFASDTHFVMTGSISASGSVMSLLDNGMGTLTSIPCTYCFEQLFANCTALTTAPELPAETLLHECYGQMFLGCTNLTTAPALPATTLVGYCYTDMFNGCTSLTAAPSLPAMSAADHCYYCMFSGCTALTTAPALPATTLSSTCYFGMFSGCTSLTTPPALPAVTLNEDCYMDMFDGCTSLIVSDTSGTGYSNAWTIPTSNTFRYSYDQYNMFSECATGAGRASDSMAGEAGQSYTYYTQNTPIS